MWRLCVVIALAAVGLGVGLSWRPPAMTGSAMQDWPADGKMPAAKKVPAAGCRTELPPMHDA